MKNNSRNHSYTILSEYWCYFRQHIITCLKKLDIRIYDSNDVSIYFLCLFYGPHFLFFASLILVINFLQVDGLIKTELFQLSHIVALILIHGSDKLIIIYSLLNIIFIIHLFQGICFHPKVYLSNFVFQNVLHSKDHIRIAYYVKCYK